MKTKHLLSFLFFGVFFFVGWSCRKNEKGEQARELNYEKITDPLKIEKVKEYQNQKMKEGLQVFYFDSEKEGIKSRVENVKIKSKPGAVATNSIVCNGIEGGSSTNMFTINYRYGDCSTLGSYISENMRIKLIFPVGTILLTTTNIPVKIKYGSITLNTTANVVGAGTSSTYLLNVNNFTFNDYCSVSTVDVVCTVEVQCPDESVTSGDLITTVDVASNRTDICKSLSPVSFQPNVGGNGTVGFNGYLPCSNPLYNPCMAYANGIDFFYRKVGTVTWSIYTLNPYLNNAVQGSGLSSGVYEWMYRNIKYVTGSTNTVSCYGLFSEIKTVTIN